MAAQVASLLVWALAASGTRAQDSENSGSYLKFPVYHSTNPEIFDQAFVRRDVETAKLQNRTDVAYYARLEIGSPAQSNYVQIDTGSFELWVSPQCSNLQSTTDQNFCRGIGTYDPTKSRTSKVSSTTKTLRYGIGSANIYYVLDDITLNGTNANLKQVQFGVARSSEDQFAGILGIGHGENETIGYKNFVDALQAQGVTQTKAYSVALGLKSEQAGVILFGGIDTNRFTGSLQKQPIIPKAQTPDGVRRFWIQMSSLGISQPNKSAKKYDNTSMAVFLDTGATLTLLPPRLAASIAADFKTDRVDSTRVDSTGFYPVDCGLVDQAGSVDFAFNGVTIKVSYREMIRQLLTTRGSTVCYLGIQPDDRFVLLGDSFLRSAYSVFDITSDAVYLAQYANCGSANEQEITSSTDYSKITGGCRAAGSSGGSGGSSSSSSTARVASGTATALPTVTVTAGATSTSRAAAHAATPNGMAPLAGMAAAAAVGYYLA